MNVDTPQIYASSTFFSSQWKDMTFLDSDLSLQGYHFITLS